MPDVSTLFQPKSIAVFGASANPGKLGNVLLKNLITYDFKGQIFPVNSQGENVFDLKGYKSIKDIPSKVDLALISIPNNFVFPVIKECGECGVKNAIILSSGFGEAGDEGKKTQQMIRDIREKTGLRLVGPNCMGIYNIAHHLNATYFWELPRKQGPLSFVSQSGAYGGIFFHEIKKQKLAISKFISIGNMVDIDHVDILEYLKEDKETKVIALFIEEIRNGKKFIDTIANMNKPIVALKAGKTEVGRRAAMSHTGSMAGSYEVFEAMCKQYGVILAENSDDFFDTIKAFLSNDGILPKGNNTTIMTISGGPSVITSDACQTIGLNMPEIDDKTKKDIQPLVPSFAALNNPVDMTPQITPANYNAVVDKIMQQNYIDSCIAINCGLDSNEFGQAFANARKKYNKPVHAYIIDNPKIETVFEEHNIPNFSSPERTAIAMKKLAQYSQYKQNHTAAADIKKLQSSSALNDYMKGKLKILRQMMARKLLNEYGLPCVKELFVTAGQDIKAGAKQLGYPLVVKVAGDGMVHKSDKGGVIAGVQNEEKLQEAVSKLKNAFGADVDLLLQKMIPKAVEIILGAHEDAVFGHVILAGIGGITTEVYKDVSIGICPVDQTMAYDMIRSLKGVALLEGFRGLPVVNKDMIAALIVKFSTLIESNPQIKEMDINPIMINGDGAFAVDTLLVL
ncbi:MAG: acetate--CoA ligase family protein [Bacteroidales bacterium]|jgi:acetate---CoA ligase (ADP-forming)